MANYIDAVVREKPNFFGQDAADAMNPTCDSSPAVAKKFQIRLSWILGGVAWLSATAACWRVASQSPNQYLGMAAALLSICTVGGVIGSVEGVGWRIFFGLLASVLLIVAMIVFVIAGVNLSQALWQRD